MGLMGRMGPMGLISLIRPIRLILPIRPIRPIRPVRPIRKGKEMISSFSLALATQEGERLLFTIFVMFVAAKLAAEIFERMKQPAVAGEILAGVIIGPRLVGVG